MLVELLRHGGVELSRRWIGALLLVPIHERQAVVEAVERQVVSLYASDPADDTSVATSVQHTNNVPSGTTGKARRIRTPHHTPFSQNAPAPPTTLAEPKPRPAKRKTSR